ncbi:transcriptional regulator, TetR family [Pedobacter westerhofensis]|uniref:Transcriptional regulator, TetR family n=1 Tax=Pedobacter westerhofensis TaxID=425512 RepID=A0A521BQK2_9SPHI|nr:TetR/AcrR family transcriptional regulator [Pedobacter westerhofensis]SMO49335.1 transcriptional regulator, TetR family [Pedobacter westerhofensis]
MKESAAKNRILDVASRLFYEQGYNSTGINQIIEEAEIARASLYNHFPSKRDLLTSYIQRAEDIWFEELEAFVGHIKNPKKKLLALFDHRISRQLKFNFGGCRFIKVGAELPNDDLAAFELIDHQKSRLKEYIHQLLLEINPKNELLQNLEMLNETIFLLIEGATVTAGITKNPEALQSAKKIAETLLGQ